MMTIEQVKKDIAHGKVNRIYYSSGTLWWTHLDDDLKDSTERGVLAKKVMFERMMNDPRVPAVEKERIKSIYNMSESSPHQIPLDPSGSPLFQYTEQKDIREWVDAAERKPEHFGRHGLRAFMAAHHQNCFGRCARTWDEINNAIDVFKDKRGFNL